MNYEHYVGIDVSKETLDVAVINQDGMTLKQVVVANSAAGWRKWVKGSKLSVSETLFCLEPTGHYSNIAVAVLLDMKAQVWLAVPADIRSSIGLQRGKNDQIDALRIAQYAYRFRDKARLVEQSETQRQELQQLLTQRELLIKDRAKYKAQVSDYKGRISKEAYRCICQANQDIVKQLDKAIEKMEAQLQEKINAIPEFKEQYALLQSIPGVGKVLSLTLVVFTDGFHRFDNPRSLACHAGVAPFEYKSGSSVRGKNRVSQRANKRLKTLLHMAALSAVRVKGDLKTYYERKVAEGKNKMCVINAIRNKLLHRVFAVLKRKSPYCLELP